MLKQKIDVGLNPLVCLEKQGTKKNGLIEINNNY